MTIDRKMLALIGGPPTFPFWVAAPALFWPATPPIVNKLPKAPGLAAMPRPRRRRGKASSS